MLGNDKGKVTKSEVSINVQNTIRLDPQNPIPINYGGETFYVIRGKKYIPFLGKDNNLPNLLLEARLTSTTQNACIQSIAQSVIGNGLTFLEVEKPLEELIEWMKCVNNEQDSLNDVMLGTVDGERSIGNQFIEIVKGAIGNKKFLKIYLHPMQYCRLAEPDDKGEIKEVIISRLFAKKTFKGKIPYDARRIPLWSPNALDKNSSWFQDTKDSTFRTMLHFKNKVSGVDYYGLPASIAGLRYQVLEGRSAQYNLDNFENNMVLGGMLFLKSAMTQEEAVKQAEEIFLTHIGEGKTGRIAVVSSEGGLKDVEFTPFTTDKEGSYIELDKRIEEKIIDSNGWHGALLGSNRTGALGNGGEYIRSIWDSKEASLMKPYRKKLIDKVVVPIFKIWADHFGKNEILKYKMDFKTAMPFSFLGEIDPDNFMQVNEARLLAGEAVDESKEGVYLCELKQKQQNVPGSKKPEEATNNK